jgi:choline dehydrogenase-like flavoprotein
VSDSYDVIIVGTGAGGGTLARHLVPSGKRILLLEQGDWLAREPQNWSTADVFIDNRYNSAAALLQIEHHWAVPLRDAIAWAGGFGSATASSARWTWSRSG